MRENKKTHICGSFEKYFSSYSISCASFSVARIYRDTLDVRNRYCRRCRSGTYRPRHWAYLRFDLRRQRSFLLRWVYCSDGRPLRLSKSRPLLFDPGRLTAGFLQSPPFLLQIWSRGPVNAYSATLCFSPYQVGFWVKSSRCNLFCQPLRG